MARFIEASSSGIHEHVCVWEIFIVQHAYVKSSKLRQNHYAFPPLQGQIVGKGERFQCGNALPFCLAFGSF